MNSYDEFFSTIEACYGSYNSDYLKELVVEYVMDNFQESDLENLFRNIISKHSTQYKTPPDIAVIKNLSSSLLEVEAIEAWDLVCKKVNPYRDIVFSDPRIYAALKAMGGHIAFSKRENKDEVWTQKRFIELFEMYTKNPPQISYPVMQGLGDLRGDIIMIGDEETCKKIVSESIAGRNLIEDLTKGIKTIPSSEEMYQEKIESRAGAVI